MILYTIKIKNIREKRYRLIRFCEEHKIYTYITYQEEDIFEGVLFIDVLVPAEAINKFQNEYKPNIIQSEPL